MRQHAAISVPQANQNEARGPPEDLLKRSIDFWSSKEPFLDTIFDQFGMDMGGLSFKKATLAATAEPFGDPDP